jgi:tetratricopeptide (TPR) repeat protein
MFLRRALPAAAFFSCFFFCAGSVARAQTEPQAPGHQHYKKDEKANQPSPTGQLAPRLQNLGNHAFPVTTLSRDAQQFMNQGLNLSYGFNHAESGRAFKEAARLDPMCAMAYWGQALVLGPNINALMPPEEEPKAYELVQKAVSLKANASLREQAYIDALAKRYTGKAEDRAKNDRAYAAAMREVAKAYPDDLDAQTLFAEAVMDLQPWGYWTRDGRPKEGIEEVVATIESVMTRDPNHPGALHFYIHLMEPTTTPERAEVAADRLLTLMPGAGHMVHMPSHIYQRIGRYADAANSNELAVTADEDYITQCRAQGLYPMGYYPHNIHFLWFAASADGRSQLAIDSARKLAEKVPLDQLKQTPMLAGFAVVPYYALTRFGHWDEMLKEPKPPDDSLYMTGMWHYARGLAFLGKGNLPDAEKSLAEVRRIAKDPAIHFQLFSPNSAASVFAIAPEVLGGEVAAAKKDYDDAVNHLQKAVLLEDSLVYTEPFEWHYPPRQALGAVLLEAGRAREAETVYWEDLKSNRENGWSLFGLMKALEAQNKTEEAAAVRSRFEKAWARADVKLTASIMR